MHVLALLWGVVFFLICIIPWILGSLRSCSFLFCFHTITRLHELDGLLILMGMNNRSISWRIWSKFVSLLFSWVLVDWVPIPFISSHGLLEEKQNEMGRTQ